MTFREMRESDLAELGRLYAGAFNAAPWFDKWTEETAARRLSDLLHTPGAFGLIAEEDGAPVGMAAGCAEQYFDGVVFQLKELCVREDLRRRGIGTALMEEYEKRLRAMGIRSALLFTSEEDLPFYRGRGYAQVDGMILLNKEL
ncbi:MAG TPA: GNAT family N-acetyltransferase [Oscillospiraceae bacterium]|nr:GNAT family N-acetyltransferase [Oscillospiraceae bacterium]HNW04622.1 GNAT family N-acetyltransferase [Oscillospiraceae bacterium]HPW00355.1 GNAT family N-acetyltransferase [Oscillospiraceae bacterium]